MSNSWTDRRRRSVINICVNCRDETIFLESQEESLHPHTGQLIFDYLERALEKVGVNRVVQVVTDNTTNNMEARDLFLERHPSLFWSCCAAYTLDLTFEALVKLPRFVTALAQANALTVFIYVHHSTLALMRVNTGKRDIIRPRVIRFASAFLTLQSIYEKKDQFRLLFTSIEWASCRYSHSAKRRTASASVLSTTFWSEIATTIAMFDPFVRVFRLADTDRFSSMPFIYGELEAMKRQLVEVCGRVKRHYRPILGTVDLKVKGRLDEPLYLTAYYLNPFYFYKSKVEILQNPIFIEALMSCVEKFFYDDFDAQSKVVNTELLVYNSGGSLFGHPLALHAFRSATSAYEFSTALWFGHTELEADGYAYSIIDYQLLRV